MKSLITDETFWKLFPDARIGVLVIENLDNTDAGSVDKRQRIGEALERAHDSARTHFTESVFSQNPVVAVWRDAFQKFKTKKGARSSIEALLKRVDNGRGVGPINPLVDIYNAISLEHALPCGIEDVDSIAGDMRLTITEGGNDFLALGDETNDPTLPGELCYLDAEGAVCRCWNWRENQRTMLTENTTRAVAVIESVDPSRTSDLTAALDDLANRITDLLGATVVSKTILTADNREVKLAD